MSDGCDGARWREKKEKKKGIMNHDIKKIKINEIKYLKGEEPQEFLSEVLILLKKHLSSFTFEFTNKEDI